MIDEYHLEHLATLKSRVINGPPPLPGAGIGVDALAALKAAKGTNEHILDVELICRAFGMKMESL